MFKKTILFFAAIALTCFVSGSAKAATITPGPLVISYDGDGALFSESNIEPGDRVSKTLTITNNGRVNHNFAIATQNVSGDLADKMVLSAIEDGNVIWANTITELANLETQSKFITSLNPNETKQIVIEADFASSNGNDAAGKNVTFDIVYGTEEAEPAARTFSIFSTNQAGTTTPTASVTVSAVASVTPVSGEVKGEETESNGLNPWYLVIAPAAFVASLIFLPEFIIAGSLTAIGGGATYILGYSSSGWMDKTLFYSILIVELIVLIILAYYMFHHDNRASRRIKGYKHRLRIR
jgi:hypothetical protein